MTSSHVQITVAPLGFVKYDAQTLPLVSPDGRAIAVQEGEAPTWDTLLATDRQEPADLARIVIYSLAGVGPVRSTTATISQGACLGRDADREGFLIESVRPDASRWIGLVHWDTAATEWLVQGDAVASHAAIVDTGATRHGLVYERRVRGAARSEVVYRDAQGDESVLASPDVSYMFPTPSPDGSTIIACAAGNSGSLDLIAVHVIDDAQHPGARKLGAVVAQRPLGVFPDVLAAAHQVFASIQPSAWCSPFAAQFRSSIVFTHPSRGRAGILSPSDAALTWMPEKSVSAAAWTSPDGSDVGFFCTAPRDLVFQACAHTDQQPAPTRVLPSPYVARVVDAQPQPQLLLFGPAKQRQDELEVLRLGVGSPP